jgi:hypothetical protein
MTNSVDIIPNETNALDFVSILPMVLIYTRDAIQFVKDMYGYEPYEIMPENIIGLGREHYFVLCVYGLPLVKRIIHEFLGDENDLTENVTTELVVSLLNEMIDEFYASQS